MRKSAIALAVVAVLAMCAGSAMARHGRHIRGHDHYGPVYSPHVGRAVYNHGHHAYGGVTVYRSYGYPSAYRSYGYPSAYHSYGYGYPSTRGSYYGGFYYGRPRVGITLGF